jgi:hypothetical protein
MSIYDRDWYREEAKERAKQQSELKKPVKTIMTIRKTYVDSSGRENNDKEFNDKFNLIVKTVFITVMTILALIVLFGSINI